MTQVKVDNAGNWKRRGKDDQLLEAQCEDGNKINKKS